MSRERVYTKQLTSKIRSVGVEEEKHHSNKLQNDPVPQGFGFRV